MTVEELKVLAEKGDCKAIAQLGVYYMNDDENHQNDIGEALKWFNIGAEKGDIACMHFSGIAGHLHAHVIRTVLNKPDYNDIVSNLEMALYWAQKALENGSENANKTIIDIKGELGIAYYYLSIYSRDNNKIGPTTKSALKKAIDYMLPIYKECGEKEVQLFLGFALNDYSLAGMTSRDDDVLAHQLLKECVDEHFESLKLAAIASMYIGIRYTEGRGCKVNYDLAVQYFLKAHNAGQDCSEMLRSFKKKLFGGYKYIG